MPSKHAKGTWTSPSACRAWQRTLGIGNYDELVRWGGITGGLHHLFRCPSIGFTFPIRYEVVMDNNRVAPGADNFVAAPDPMTLSRAARSVWAKTGGQTHWLPLHQHMTDSFHAASRLYDEWLSRKDCSR